LLTKKKKNQSGVISAAFTAAVHVGAVARPGLAAICVSRTLINRSQRAMKELLKGLENLWKELSLDCIMWIRVQRLWG